MGYWCLLHCTWHHITLYNYSSFPFFNSIGGVMVSVLASRVVDHGFGPVRIKPKTIYNRTDGLMVSVFASRVVNHGFGPVRVNPNTIKLLCVVFFTKHVALKSKSEEWWTRDHYHASDCYISVLALYKSN